MERVNAVILARTGSDVTDDSRGRQPPDLVRRQAAAADADPRDGAAAPASPATAISSSRPRSNSCTPRRLLHDDVVDESDMRRGKLAARMLWGNEASVLVGDFLLGQALQDDGRGRLACRRSMFSRPPPP